MRFVLLFLFLALVIVLLAVWAYRQVIRSVAAKRREIAELRRRPTPEERYRAGEIDVFELERLLEAERRQLETKRRGDQAPAEGPLVGGSRGASRTTSASGSGPPPARPSHKFRSTAQRRFVPRPNGGTSIVR